MFELDYSISEQILILEYNIPGFSINRNTYKKYIKELLNSSIYVAYKKRQLFLRHIQQVKNAICLYSDPKAQFEYLQIKGERSIRGGYHFTVDVNDYYIFYCKYKSAFEEYKSKKTMYKSFFNS